MVDEHEESFAELFEQSLQQKRRTVQPGEKVSGTIVQVGSERALVDLGDGLDGMIDLAEITPKGEKPTAKPGDRVEAFVIKIENRVAMLAKTAGKGAGARRALEDAAQTGVPVEGRVVEVNKGGYVVEIAGTRCFCPLGQMDVRRIEDPATMIGQHLAFRVTEFRGGRDVVLSRRALLEEEQAAKAAETRRRLEVGARFTGTVTNVRDFGAFVDIGGLEGLVPASELSYARHRPQEVVHAGQQVEVEVLRLEPPGPKDKGERITLSMRALAQDPWDLVTADLPEGTVVRGKVVRVQPFGAFVEIVPGVDGLLHVSAFGRRIGHPSDVVNPGDEVAVRIDALDPTQRRISLSYVAPEEAAQLAAEYGAAEGALAAPTPEATAATVAPKTGSPSAPRERMRPSEPQPGGMSVRRAPKAGKEEAPAAAAAQPAPAAKAAPAAEGKARVLGRQTPVAPTAEALAAAPSAPRKPEDMPLPPVGSVLEVTVDKIEAFGLFVKWNGGRGLLPASELELPKSADLRKAFPAGTKLKAAVVEVRPDGKVRLSAKAAAHAEEAAEAREWMQTQRPAAAGKTGFGTFADLFKGKLGK